MHSCVTSKNVKWCHLIWPTLYILWLKCRGFGCSTLWVSSVTLSTLLTASSTTALTSARVVALLKRCWGALVSVQASWISWHVYGVSQDWVPSYDYTTPLLSSLYGAETWTLIKSDEQKQEFFQMSCLWRVTWTAMVWLSIECFSHEPNSTAKHPQQNPQQT